MTESPPSLSERVTQYLRNTALDGAHTIILQGDASTRRYVRVFEANGTTHVLLVHAETTDPRSPFVEVAGLLDRIGVPVPAIVGCEPELGIVALEDLGDATLQQSLSTATPNERRDYYLTAIELIDTMQQRAPECASSHPGPFALAFDVEKLTWELEFFLTHFIGKMREITPSATDRSALREEFDNIARELASEPRVFCHRDYHSRNLMVHEGHLYVIDFQDARMGPDTYDLASLLRDCYVDLGAPFVDDMVDAYLRRSERPGREAFMSRFDLVSVQRHLKALGTFGFQVTSAGSNRYQADVTRTLGYLADVFHRRPRFARLRSTLARSVPELG